MRSKLSHNKSNSLRHGTKHRKIGYLSQITALVTLQLLLTSTAFSGDQINTELQADLSDRLWHYLTDGASISAGVGGRTITIDVTRLGTEDHGKMIENIEDASFLTYNTKASYFGHSNVGYGWLFNVSTFHLKDQELPNQEVISLGTEVDGYFAYAIPTVFYNFGDRHRGHYLRTGIGLGVGVADFNGNVVLTESLIPSDRVDISNGTSNLFVAFGIFIDYQWQNFTIRIDSGGPNLKYDGYEMNVSGTSIMLGATYYLDD